MSWCDVFNIYIYVGHNTHKKNHENSISTQINVYYMFSPELLLLIFNVRWQDIVKLLSQNGTITGIGMAYCEIIVPEWHHYWLWHGILWSYCPRMAPLLALAWHFKSEIFRPGKVLHSLEISKASIKLTNFALTFVFSFSEVSHSIHKQGFRTIHDVAFVL